ncbi:MAG: undecaprenyl-phosphate alpha-N-acetylglucosaminyl 1-phosphate transferase [Planctomycetaceae bacterium]|nr:undecaprenyl-phosphate alpha-N-acetylglucosaminyl 1-phosphate transferase [Planctomycetaceae bacterium]
MLGPVLLMLPLGFLIAAPLSALLVVLGRKAGTLDSVGVAGHAKVLRSIPNIGGIAIAAATLLPLLGGLVVLATMGDQIAVRFQSLESFTDRLGSQQLAWWTIVAGGIAMHVLGLVDDRRAIGPWFKLAIQLGFASAVVVMGDLRLVTVLDAFGPAGTATSAVLTVVWIVAICNAINFLDNMDGLAGGVAAIAAAIFLAATIINGQWFTAAAFALLCGSLLGFLLQNVPPARLFMGDGGSLLVGWLLATLTIRTTFVDTSDPDFALGTAWYGVLMPVVVLAIPIYDLVAVSLLRIRQGRSPLKGDQQHLSHRLVRLGLSKRSAVIVIWSLTASTGVGGIVLGSVAPWQASLVGAQTVCIVLVLALLEAGARRRSGDGPGQA